MSSFDYPIYDAVIPNSVNTGKCDEAVVTIVGAGPVGLTAALDLACHNVPVVVIDDDNTVSTGSRAICWSKRTLEIFSRLGCIAPMMAKGITWQRGRVFARDKEIHRLCQVNSEKAVRRRGKRSLKRQLPLVLSICETLRIEIGEELRAISDGVGH